MAPSRRKRGPSPVEAADRIHSAAIRLLRAVRREDEASGLGPARLSALSVLVFRGPSSLKALAAAEQVRPPTMSRIVDGLVAAGLARRSSAAHDARSVRIEATPRGRSLLGAARRRRIRFLASRFAGLHPGERRALLAAAAVIERALGGRAR